MAFRASCLRKVLRAQGIPQETRFAGFPEALK